MRLPEAEPVASGRIAIADGDHPRIFGIGRCARAGAFPLVLVVELMRQLASFEQHDRVVVIVAQFLVSRTR